MFPPSSWTCSDVCWIISDRRDECTCTRASSSPWPSSSSPPRRKYRKVLELSLVQNESAELLAWIFSLQTLCSWFYMMHVSVSWLFREVMSQDQVSEREKERERFCLPLLQEGMNRVMIYSYRIEPVSFCVADISVFYHQHYKLNLINTARHYKMSQGHIWPPRDHDQGGIAAPVLFK